MTIAEDMIDDGLSDLYAPYDHVIDEMKLNLPRCGNCNKQFHIMSLTTLYTEDESQHDEFCEKCITECSHELWLKSI